MTPADRARAAAADADRAGSIERGDEPTGVKGISPELHEIAAMRRRVAELEGLRATDLRRINQLDESLAARNSDASFGRDVRRGGGMLKATIALVLLVVSTTVGTIVWFEHRAESIAKVVTREEYDSEKRRLERARDLDTALTVKLALATSEISRMQQEKLNAIDARLIRIEAKLDAGRRRP